MTSHPGQVGQQRHQRWPWIMLGICAILVTIPLLVAPFVDSTPASGTTSSGDEHDARDICRQAVEDRLVSPSSADFGSMDTNELMGSGTAYRVVGHVDAENRMGAAVRIDYECKTEHVSGTEWEIIDLQASER